MIAKHFFVFVPARRRSRGTQMEHGKVPSGGFRGQRSCRGGCIFLYLYNKTHHYENDT